MENPHRSNQRTRTCASTPLALPARPHSSALCLVLEERIRAIGPFFSVVFATTTHFNPAFDLFLFALSKDVWVGTRKKFLSLSRGRQTPHASKPCFFFISSQLFWYLSYSLCNYWLNSMINWILTDIVLDGEVRASGRKLRMAASDRKWSGKGVFKPEVMLKKQELGSQNIHNVHIHSGTWLFW